MTDRDHDPRRRAPEARLPRRARGPAAQPEVVLRRRPHASEGAIFGERPEFGVPDFERKVRA